MMQLTTHHVIAQGIGGHDSVYNFHLMLQGPNGHFGDFFTKESVAFVGDENAHVARCFAKYAKRQLSGGLDDRKFDPFALPCPTRVVGKRRREVKPSMHATLLGEPHVDAAVEYEGETAEVVICTSTVGPHGGDEVVATEPDIRVELADAWNSWAAKCPLAADNKYATTKYRDVACGCIRCDGKPFWCMIALKDFYCQYNTMESGKLMDRLQLPEFDADKLAAKLGWAVHTDGLPLKVEKRTNGKTQLQRGNFDRCNKVRLPVIVGWYRRTERL
jgi:hypothetical protein